MEYAGTELGLFAKAVNWKTYVARTLSPWVRGHVLDAGAGIGSNISFLTNPSVTAWTALEPDASLGKDIIANGAGQASGVRPRLVIGVVDDLPTGDLFDTILYLDVLEHISNDQAEVAKAANLLAPQGVLAVLAPAHQFLFSPFDAAIGHHRRYGRGQLLALTPNSCRIECCRMLDSAGFFASLANRALLRQADPTPTQIAVWDRLLVPISRALDWLTAYRFGKSILVVWRRVD